MIVDVHSHAWQYPQHFTDDFRQQAKRARAGQEVDDNRRYELQRQAQEIEWNRGGFIIWGFRNQVDAYSNLTTGLKPHRYMPCDAFGFKNVSFVQEA